MTQRPGTTCPKCGYEIADAAAQDCPRCGAVFAKVASGRRLVKPSEIVVTTGDLKDDYRILGPVFFAVSNRGSQLQQLSAKHGVTSPARLQESGLLMGLLLDEWPVGQQQFPVAFAIAVEEIRRQALRVGGDAVVWLRMDIDLDTTGFQYFYMQVYGTAVLRGRPAT